MNLKDLFLDELADMYDAENRIAKALPKMAKAATDENLKAAILSHLEETKGQIEKLKQVFAAFDEKAKGKECKATVGLLEEAMRSLPITKANPRSTPPSFPPARKWNITKSPPTAASSPGENYWTTMKPSICWRKFLAKKNRPMRN